MWQRCTILNSPGQNDTLPQWMRIRHGLLSGLHEAEGYGDRTYSSKVWRWLRYFASRYTHLILLLHSAQTQG